MRDGNQGWTSVRRLTVLAMALAAFGFSPAAAVAETFYAAPPPPGGTGVDTNDCLTVGTPCTLKFAVETKAVNSGDEVVVLPGPGSYTDTPQLQINNPITVRGLSAQQRPEVRFDLAGQAVQVFAGGVVLRDLGIANIGSGEALSAGGDTTGERLVVSSESSTATCGLFGGILRDSFCLNSVGSAIHAASFSGSVNQRLVNVTAIAPSVSGVGLRVGAFGDGVTPAEVTVSATNVITRGGVSDIRTQTNFAIDDATATLDHSNYLNISSGNGSGMETITPAGTNANQTTDPVFVSASNFHQAATSPTIDTGASNPGGGGDLDFDGQPRCMGAGTDIGADEFTAPACSSGAPPPVAPPAGLANLLRAKVKGKRLTLTLVCGASGGCGGNEIEVRTAKKVDLNRFAAAAKRKRILLARGDASLAAGETARVRLKLRKQGRKLFRARKKVRAKATITATGSSETEQLKIKRK